MISYYLSVSKKFRKLSEMVGSLKWDHTDLFFWRETSQKSFRSRILKNNKVDTLTLFGFAQLEIACEIIDESKPKCIVISNALHL